MKCKTCGNNLFFIRVVPCCDDCDQNSAWDDETKTYVSDLKIIDEKKLSRSQVEDEGECCLGTAHGGGCHQYICSLCRHMEYLPVLEC